MSPRAHRSETHNNGRSSQQVVRTETHLFDESYLSEPNRERAEELLWPFPIFERMRDLHAVAVDGETIQPGDILEYCGGDREEFCVVIAELPFPIQRSSYTVEGDADCLLCYSNQTEDFRVFDMRSFWAHSTSERFIEHEGGKWFIHEDASSLVGLVDDVADASWPPLPDGDTDAKRSRFLQQYPYAHPPNRINPASPIPSDVQPIEDCLAQIHQGDAREVLPMFETDSVHGWVTSCPYWQQRDYGSDEQLGREPTVDRFLENLLGVINQLMRVLRPDGLGWLIIDDSFQNGALAGIPEQFHVEIEREGYEIIHHSPWTKQNPKPDPAENRYAHAHEHVFCIGHRDHDHYFDRRAVDDPTDVFDVETGGNSGHDAVFPAGIPEKIIKSAVPERVCADCGAPYERVYEVVDIRDLPSDRPQAKRALELAEEHDLSDNHLRAVRAVGLSDTGQAARTQDGTGRNSSETQRLFEETRAALGSYTREFTQANKEAVGLEPSCNCETEQTEAGIVIDPFVGSGTTCSVAKRLQRRWAGIELNEESAALAESNLGITVSDPSQLTEEDQQTVQDYF